MSDILLLNVTLFIHVKFAKIINFHYWWFVSFDWIWFSADWINSSIAQRGTYLSIIVFTATIHHSIETIQRIWKIHYLLCYCFLVVSYNVKQTSFPKQNFLNVSQMFHFSSLIYQVVRIVHILLLRLYVQDSVVVTTIIRIRRKLLDASSQPFRPCTLVFRRNHGGWDIVVQPTELTADNL